MTSSDLYLFIAFVTLLLGITWYGHARAKKLEPRQRALSNLYFEFLFSGLIACGIVYVLAFRNYVPKIYSENPTIEQLTDTVNALQGSFEMLKSTLYIGWMLVLINLLRAIYAFARTLTPPEDSKPLDLDRNSESPILGLND